MLAATALFKVSKERIWYIIPRSTHWSEHFVFTPENFIDSEFKKLFRMSRKSFYALLAIIQPYIQKQSTSFRKPIQPDRRLAIFLYHISHGVSYQAISTQFCVGKSTISGIIGNVSQAIISHLSPRCVLFSTPEQMMRTMDFWREKKGIPGVVGCIDGSHIPILKPVGTGSAYCNRKGFYSINVQGISLLMIMANCSCGGSSKTVY
jgi:hypothetical protein